MRKIILAVTLSLVTFCVLEIILHRLQKPNPTTNCYTHDSVQHHRFIPNSSCRQISPDWDVAYTINSLGFRDGEISLDKPANTKRILMLGDSFTEGKGVQLAQTFTKQLEALFNNASPSAQRYEVINGGIQSSAPILEYILLKEKGIKLHPDLVIVNLDLSDFYDEVSYTQLAQINLGTITGVAYKDTQTLTQKIIATIVNRSIFVNQLYNWWLTYSRLYSLPFNDLGSSDSDRFLAVRLEKSAQYQKYVDQVWEHIKKIKEYTDQQHTHLLVAMYPYGQLVNGSEWPSRTYWGFKIGETYKTDLFENMAQYSKQEGISFISTLPDFQSASNAPLFFVHDGHFTPEGNTVYAQSLFTFLQNHPELLQ
jgi:ABC-type Fe3+-hydroxamate transport system substrate-binding protein